MNPWWLGLAPAQAFVACAGDQHRLRWEAGELRALDHEDAEGERALAALGGQRCACVDLLDAWQRHHDDPRALVLASRGPADQLAVPDHSQPQPGLARPQAMLTPTVAARRRASGAGFVGTTQAVTSSAGRLPHAPPGPASSKTDQAEDELISLLGLAGGLPDRLVATVAAAWRERLGRRDRTVARVRPQLYAALYGRVLATLRGWLAGSVREVDVSMVGEDGAPSLTASPEGVRAELPFEWLVDVWARGLATIWGRFCLAAISEDGYLWRLETVGPDIGAKSIVTFQLHR